MVGRVVASFLPKGRFANVEYIGVDETSCKRSHRYVTIVTDLLHRRVIWVGEGKSADTLSSFFRELGPQRCKKITMVAMDMSASYQKSVRDNLPNADIVFDRFHVIKLLLEAIGEVRRDEVRKLRVKDALLAKAIKSTRFALLRNPRRHLSPRDQDAIHRVQSTNRRLARAYELRCDIEDLWELTEPEEAREFLMSWTRSALLSRRQPLRKFAKTVRRHMDGILGFFTWHGQTSGLCEGINNKVKLALHKAFGLHSTGAFASMIHLQCGGFELPLRPPR